MEQKYAYLLQQNIITDQDLQKAISISKDENKSVEEILINRFKIKKEDIGKALSTFYDCRFVAYDPLIPLADEIVTVSKLEKSELLKQCWVPLNWDEKSGVEVLVDDPLDIVRTEQIRMALNTKNVFFSVGIREDIEEFVNHIFDQLQFYNFDFDKVPNEICEQVTELVDYLIIAAYRNSASDIHIEQSNAPQKSSIKFRINGVCQEYMTVPNTVAIDLANHIKFMANLDAREVCLPQNGRIQYKRSNIPSLELRVATYPTVDLKEDVVLRIHEETDHAELNELVLNKATLSVLHKIIKIPYGLFLLAKGVASGTDTIVHAILHHLNKPGLKILTAEDPVKIKQKGIRQLEVNSEIGLDFPRAIRSFLKADPDIIMIGEMNDRDTASLCIKSALNGHQVFSMLRTGCVVGVFERLRYLGLNPFDLSDALLGVFAQKLVRRLCSECREPYHPSRSEHDNIIRDFGGILTADPDSEYREGLTLYRSTGCPHCSEIGYRGRTAITELLEITPRIRSLVKNIAHLGRIAEQAANEGMLTLRQDGMLKVFQGLTDISELRRVFSI